MDLRQEERLAWLIDRLQKENPAWESCVQPALRRNKEDLLRALLTIRPPQPASADFLAVQDAYLRNEAEVRGIVNAAALPCVPGQPRLALWQGDITRLAADAIVNAANSQLLGCFRPGHACIDNAIHAAAGIRLRLACHALMREQGHEEPTGRARITQGYNLPSGFVLHTVGPIIRGAVRKRDAERLASCYSSCLELAAAHGLRSLAFCCISTGVFGFPRKAAAEIAVRSVRSFLDAHAGLEKVIFNVFTREDYDIYQHILGQNIPGQNALG